MADFKNIPLVTAIAAGFTLLISSQANAFTFVEIANTNTPDFTNIDSSAYAINDLGEVAFIGETMGASGIFVGDGGNVSVVVDTSDGFTGFRELDINSAGTVVFEDGTGIFTVGGDGTTAPVITMASSLGLIGYTAEDQLRDPLINESGTVAFFAQNSDEGEEGIFLSQGENIAPIAEAPDIFPFRFSLNNNDEVAFFGQSDLAVEQGGDAIFVGDATGIPTALSDPFDLDTIERVTINDAGTVVYDAIIDPVDGMLTVGVFVQNVDDVDLLFDSTAFDGELPRPTINNQGTIVFDTGSAIFDGPDPTTDKVIGVGDMLLGSAITSIGFSQRNGLNNQGQIAFAAEFEDGSVGIFRADPEEPDTQSVPEPMSLLGLLAAGVASQLCISRKMPKAS